MKLIDVSKHNGSHIDWKKVKESGIEGVIIRAGYGRFTKQEDGCFKRNYECAKAAGLHVGAYWYSYATTAEMAIEEAETFLEVAKGKSFDLPVYYDIEDKCHLKLPKEVCTAVATSFCKRLEAESYFAGVYSFDSFFVSNLDVSIQELFSIWAARVEDEKPKYVGKYDIWQHSWKGKVNGISGNVDLNICYKDFPAIITEHELNGCKKTDTPEALEEDTEKPAEEEKDSIKVDVTAKKTDVTPKEAEQLRSSLSSLGMTVALSKSQ
jgi:GH25 family lysozyme M1 (1,4-beta-N-acetylmuramidase)